MGSMRHRRNLRGQEQEAAQNPGENWRDLLIVHYGPKSGFAMSNEIP